MLESSTVYNCIICSLSLGKKGVPRLSLLKYMAFSNFQNIQSDGELHAGRMATLNPLKLVFSHTRLHSITNVVDFVQFRE